MKISVFQIWVFFSISLSIVLQQTCAEIESTKYPFDQNQFLSRDFQMKNRNQLQSQEKKWPNLGFHSILAGVLCFAAASISSAGGLGGGGLFLPILNLVAGLDMKTAAPVSSFMVTGGSLANFIYCLSIKTSKPLIDYDIALLSEPCMLLGVSLGVICNVMFPEWLITVLLAIFLASSTFTTCRAGFAHWRSESVLVKVHNVEKKEEGNGSANLGGFTSLEGGLPKLGISDVGEGLGSLETPLLEEKTEVGFVFPMWKLGILLVIWVSFFAVNVLRGDQGKQSLIQIKPCGIGYWLISGIQIPLALVFTGWILLQKESTEHHSANPQVITAEKPGRAKLIFPLMSLLSGTLGGVFGIGGGMLINPILLQIGIPPQITAATSSFMVLFSSSMSSVQYFMLGMKRLDYALVFAVICFVSSLLGLALIQRAIAKYGRASLIVFSVGTVLALSAVLITSFGAIDVCRDYTSSQYMGFKLPC